MVIRKPYAFLIRNFKKIHIALLVLSLYIYYKVLRTNSFVGEFVALGSYDPNIDPVNHYVTTLLLIAILLSFIGNILLILLLRHKQKPWKLYLLPAIEYGLLFFVLIWARSFFNLYDGSQTGMDIRLIRDVILISMLGQFPIVIIYSMRILGVDLQKFNFKMDEEYLEMDKEDRAELEINFNIDYHMFIRLYNKTIRYLKYFYFEHKRICNTIAIIIAIILLRKIIIFIFITNKSYKEGEVYNANGYTIVIKNSYYTDKDKMGNLIEKDKAFVVVDLSITNNWGERELNLNNFHIVKGIDNYTQVSTTHATDFEDLGKTVDSIQTIKRDETINTILIYKIKKDKRVRTNKYVLFYQEINGGSNTYLRKIKLKIKDISQLNAVKEYKVDDKMVIKTSVVDEAIAFDEGEIYSNLDYSIQKCKVANECYMEIKNLEPDEANKYVKIPFSSKEFDGKELVDFSTNYGKIIYKDSKGKDREIAFKSAVPRKYYGKYLYIKLDNKILDKNKNIKLKYVVRNNQYLITIPIEGADEE